jgi:aryl-alcohol dehydrogenase-like predicted oxidoreductase
VKGRVTPANGHRQTVTGDCMSLQKRRLGRTGVEVTTLGLGGEGILRTFGHDAAAVQLINRALDLGINYCESARAYAGSESYYGKALKERRREVFLTSKSHARDKDGALAHLRETLSNMRTDYVDLWQVHDVRTDDDVERIFGPKGAIEAFIEAKKNGLARFIGVTGHQDPPTIKRCIEKFDFDTVLLPVNPAESSYNGFLEEVIPLAIMKQMGIIGMKVYFRGFAAQLPFYNTMEPFLRFALSQPITTSVIGCDSIAQLEQNVTFAANFEQMSEIEIQDLKETVAPHARSLMFYKP